jgi:AmiR/NasT family two-component response regulator
MEAWMRVIVVDDEAVIRMGLRAMLEEAGHQVVGTAINGRSAVVLAEIEKPDLILMDIKMPEMDGLEAARQIMGKHPAPIVMLTAYSQRELIEQAKAASVFAYLVKPVKEEMLEPTLELAVMRFKQWKALRKEAQDLQASLVARDLVEKAKRVLMERDGLSEKEAFLKIRNQSRARRVTMAKTAEAILRRRASLDNQTS